MTAVYCFLICLALPHYFSLSSNLFSELCRVRTYEPNNMRSQVPPSFGNSIKKIDITCIEVHESMNELSIKTVRTDSIE